MRGCESVVCVGVYNQVNSRRNTTIKIEGRNQKRAEKGVSVFSVRGAMPVLARHPRMLIKVSVEITFFWHTLPNFALGTKRLLGFRHAAHAAPCPLYPNKRFVPDLKLLRVYHFFLFYMFNLITLL
jgi:hypothetical protein